MTDYTNHSRTVPWAVRVENTLDMAAREERHGKHTIPADCVTECRRALRRYRRRIKDKEHARRRAARMAMRRRVIRDASNPYPVGFLILEERDEPVAAGWRPLHPLTRLRRDHMRVGAAVCFHLSSGPADRHWEVFDRKREARYWTLGRDANGSREFLAPYSPVFQCDRCECWRDKEQCFAVPYFGNLKRGKELQSLWKPYKHLCNGCRRIADIGLDAASLQRQVLELNKEIKNVKVHH